MKKKVLIIHPALAPYRIDQFNQLSEIFDLDIIFLFKNLSDNEFNQSRLMGLLNCRTSFLLNGINFKGRFIRFGIIKWILNNKPDVVISIEFSPITILLIMLRMIGVIGQKIGTITDDSVTIFENPQTVFRKLARKFCINKLDYLVVLSENVASAYAKAYNIKRNKIIVSPILQDPDRLRNNFKQTASIAHSYINKFNLHDKKVILFVGRLVEEKNILGFLTYITDYLKSNKNCVFIIVGSGKCEHSIREYILSNELERQCILPGRFENTELYAWYLCASIFVLPSLFEPFGAVVNEALVFGTVVLCSKNAGSSVLINDNNGVIFDPSNQRATVEWLNMALNMSNPVDINLITQKKSLMLLSSRINGEWNVINEE